VGSIGDLDRVRCAAPGALGMGTAALAAGRPRAGRGHRPARRPRVLRAGRSAGARPCRSGWRHRRVRAGSRRHRHHVSRWRRPPGPHAPAPPGSVCCARPAASHSRRAAPRPGRPAPAPAASPEGAPERCGAHAGWCQTACLLGERGCRARTVAEEPAGRQPGEDRPSRARQAAQTPPIPAADPARYDPAGRTQRRVRPRPGGEHQHAVTPSQGLSAHIRQPRQQRINHLRRPRAPNPQATHLHSQPDHEMRAKSTRNPRKQCLRIGPRPTLSTVIAGFRPVPTRRLKLFATRCRRGRYRSRRARNGH
jgi:hypothetical protein